VRTIRELALGTAILSRSPAVQKFTDFPREFLVSVWFAQEFDVGVETALMDDRIARVACGKKYWQSRKSSLPLASGKTTSVNSKSMRSPF
jgi:hypothetical protein